MLSNSRTWLMSTLVARDRVERLFDGLGAHVAQRRGLHRETSAHTRAGVSGSSTSSRPSASATAFAIAAGALIVFPSPMPLAPSGVKGDGDERWPMRMSGISGAVAQR